MLGRMKADPTVHFALKLIDEQTARYRRVLPDSKTVTLDAEALCGPLELLRAKIEGHALGAFAEEGQDVQ